MSYVNFLSRMSIEAVIKGKYQLGEGPHWEEATKSLLYVDVSAHDIHRWNSVTGEDTKVNVGRLKDHLKL